MLFPAKTVEESTPRVDSEATIKYFVRIFVGFSSRFDFPRFFVAIGKEASSFLERGDTLSL